MPPGLQAPISAPHALNRSWERPCPPAADSVKEAASHAKRAEPNYESTSAPLACPPLDPCPLSHWRTMVVVCQPVRALRITSSARTAEPVPRQVLTHTYKRPRRDGLNRRLSAISGTTTVAVTWCVGVRSAGDVGLLNRSFSSMRFAARFWGDSQASRRNRRELGCAWGVGVLPVPWLAEISPRRFPQNLQLLAKFFW